jgi:small subunit ribosomal protein S6
MPATTTIYDLILLLDLGAEDDRRAKIVADTRAAIAAEGELLGDQAWGTRPLAYEIDHREAADYHLLQFSGPASLIGALEHSLRITDGVIRYRVIKLPPGSTPVAASAPPAPIAAESPAPSVAAAEPPASPDAAAEQDASPDASAEPDAAPDAAAEQDASPDASAGPPAPPDASAEDGDPELVSA